MSSYTNKTFIVFLDLPTAFTKKIDKIRQSYGHLKYSAHITLKQDEDFLINKDRLAAIIENTLANEKAIQILVKPATYHRNKMGWNIYLPVVSKRLTNLTKTISRSLEKYIDPESPRAFLSTKWEQSSEFYPHISIKGIADKSDFQNVYKAIQIQCSSLSLPLTVQCNKVTIAQWKKEDNKWKKVKTLQLP